MSQAQSRHPAGLPATVSPEILAQVVSRVAQPKNIQSSTGSHVSVQVLGAGARGITAVAPAVAQYTYKVQIITSGNKKDIIARHLNYFHTKFHSVTALRVQLIDEFKDQVPASADFNVGYFDKTTKVLLATDEDMDTMYRHYPNGGLVPLWCDARVEA